MTRKKHPRRTKRNVLLWLMFSTVILHPNPQGHSYRISDYSDKESNNSKEFSNASTSANYNTLNTTESILSSQGTTATNFSWLIFILIVSTFLAYIIICAIQDQPLNQQCLVSRLYQDVVRINLFLVWFWIFSALVWSLREEENVSLENSIARGIALLNQALFWIIILHLTVLGLLRLLVLKDKSLDPELVLLCEDEDTAMRRLRLITATVVVIALTVMYCSSANPPVYYLIKEGHISNLPRGSTAILILDTVLLVFCGVSHIVGKLWLNYEHSQLVQSYVYDERQRSMQVRRSTLAGLFRSLFTNSRRSDNENDPISFKNMPIGANLLYFMNALIAVFGFLFIFYTPRHFMGGGAFWPTITLFIGSQGVLLPIWLIVRYAKIRHYTTRRIKPMTEDVIHCIQAVISVIRNKIGGASVRPI